MIITHLSMPHISKIFQIKLAKGRPNNKRVSYTNPYLHPKVLSLRTDSPQLVQFKSNTMELGAGETQYIGLKFAPCFNLSNAEILVFLNNDQDKVEECLSISVQYE
ncbi:Nephrocystin-4 [Kappamyces sp. JEL0680]|nr:Nephrocystin-4 [Kappamyces sp. JEL0680]